ncbi:hypothetical protein [Cytobacillus oceanisediminis]|uniref:hypothetical protein n=1 Tax=Cytobacillus oceanisediminis TaxID=665099 RepID=UPI001C22A617|nr:hypothetical protein [Cytobacillus oceanisediminis]MBU8772071.1 hypothetical protein [Cytobacillus oceanisediminis]
MVAHYTNTNPSRKRIFLSRFSTYVPSDYTDINSYINYFKKKTEKFDEHNPLHWFYESNQKSISDLHKRNKTLPQGSRELSIPFCIKSQSDYAIECINNFYDIRDQVDVLCYCHETIEESHAILPALKLKEKSGIKSAMAFSVGHYGSLGTLSALDLMKALFADDMVRNIMLVVNDRIIPPFSRINYHGYLKGDATTVINISPREGPFEVTQIFISHIHSNTPFYNWSLEQFSKYETQMILSTQDFLKNKLSHSIDYFIPHMFSERFLNEISNTCFSMGIKMFQRKKWPKINFLGSDSFISLEELINTESLKENNTILLSVCSPDIGVGFLEIKVGRKI